MLLGDNKYSVLLTKASVSGTVNISNTPDLFSSIQGVAIDTISGTISGSL